MIPNIWEKFWEIDNFVIKSDIFRRFFICKNILKKLSCYHNNYFRYFMFVKYNGQQGEGFCMHVFSSRMRNFAQLFAIDLIVNKQLPPSCYVFEFRTQYGPVWMVQTP